MPDGGLRSRGQRLRALVQAGEWRRLAHKAWGWLPVVLLKRRLGAAGANFWVEPPDLILNPQCLFVGNSFKAAKGLRLWAITEHNGARYQPKITIGANVSLGFDTTLSAIDRINIGDNVLIASGVFITAHNHGQYRGPQSAAPETPPAYRPLHSRGPVIIEANCWIGEHVVILPGVHIGAGCVIGANSVVTHDVPAHTISGGNPSRVLRQFDAARGEWVAAE